MKLQEPPGPPMAPDSFFLSYDVQTIGLAFVIPEFLSEANAGESSCLNQDLIIPP